MLKKSGFLLLLVLFLFGAAYGQVSAKLMRYMDVSDTQIAFVYGGDIWIMPKTGGTAIQVTHSPGEESWPRFSPDGRSIAYTAAYNGKTDIYVMLAGGGVPARITHQSLGNRMV
ncbi:Tricorn protease like protein, partial [Acidobacteriota bacterium]